jgi:NAD-dependent dihydropyrimidine dehydrogenase PreA subunit
MIGIYLSGTGNTRHCTEKLVYLLDEQAQVLPLEDERAADAIKEHVLVVFAYPVQFSNAPVMVRDFIKNHDKLWQGKQILCMATMGAFSGDGAGCSARLFKKYGAKIIGGLHIRMPDSVCDVKLLKKSPEENKRIVLAADRKLEAAAAEIRAGRYPKEGLSFISRLAGLFGQRLWFYDKTRTYSRCLKISDACTRCGQCVKLCPMKNITMRYGKPVPGNQCTMCYRCICRCPGKAITLIGKQVHEQCQFERYILDTDLCK